MAILWFISFVISSSLAITSFRKMHTESDRLSKVLVYLGISVMFWVLSEFLIEVLFSEQWILWIHELKFIAILSTPLLLLMYVWDMYYGQAMQRKVRLILITISVIEMAGILSNPWHHMFRKSLDVIFTTTTIVATSNGPLYYSVILFMYFQAGWALLLVLKHYLNQPEIYRNRAGFLLAGISLSLLSNLIFQVLHITMDWNIDFTPLSFTFSVGVFYYGLYHFKHDGVEEKAKSLIIDQLALGVVFFDLNDNIFYANKYFCDLIGSTYEKLLAKSMKTLPTHMIEAIQALEPNKEANCECVAFNRLVIFTLRKVILKDRKGRFIGTIVFFTDVTDENRRIIQLEVEKMMAQQPHL